MACQRSTPVSDRIKAQVAPVGPSTSAWCFSGHAGPECWHFCTSLHLQHIPPTFFRHIAVLLLDFLNLLILLPSLLSCISFLETYLYFKCNYPMFSFSWLFTLNIHSYATVYLRFKLICETEHRLKTQNLVLYRQCDVFSSSNREWFRFFF